MLQPSPLQPWPLPPSPPPPPYRRCLHHRLGRRCRGRSSGRRGRRRCGGHGCRAVAAAVALRGHGNDHGTPPTCERAPVTFSGLLQKMAAWTDTHWHPSDIQLYTRRVPAAGAWHPSHIQLYTRRVPLAPFRYTFVYQKGAGWFFRVFFIRNKFSCFFF